MDYLTRSKYLSYAVEFHKSSTRKLEGNGSRPSICMIYDTVKYIVGVISYATMGIVTNLSDGEDDP